MTERSKPSGRSSKKTAGSDPAPRCGNCMFAEAVDDEYVRCRKSSATINVMPAPNKLTKHGPLGIFPIMLINEDWCGEHQFPSEK